MKNHILIKYFVHDNGNEQNTNIKNWGMYYEKTKINDFKDNTVLWMSE